MKHTTEEDQLFYAVLVLLFVSIVFVGGLIGWQIYDHKVNGAARQAATEKRIAEANYTEDLIGKKIKSYSKERHDLILEFEDGTHFTVHGYKYDLKYNTALH